VEFLLFIKSQFTTDTAVSSISIGAHKEMSDHRLYVTPCQRSWGGGK